MDNSASWYPMQYRVYEEGSEKGLVWLSILYLVPIDNNLVHTRSRMVASDGESDALTSPCLVRLISCYV